VPAALHDLEELCRRYARRDPLVVGTNVELGISVNTDHPRAVGADRLINAVAAHEKYQGALIVIDFGTATTFDVVAPDGAYEGGVIAPGVNLSAEALHNAAALLPRVEVRSTQAVIGKDTIPAMQSGLYWGYVGLVEGLVARIKTEYGQPMTVIATGGLSNLFRAQIPVIEHADPDLTIRGLALVHARNAREHRALPKGSARA
jgi:type III pantothenate kinase